MSFGKMGARGGFGSLGGNGGASSPYRFAATRLRFPSLTGTFPAAGTNQIQNFFFGTPAYTTRNPRFFIPTFYQLTTGATTSEIAAADAITFQGLSIKVGSTWYLCPTAQFTTDPTTELSGYLLDPIPGVTLPADTLLEGRIAFAGASGAMSIGVSRAFDLSTGEASVGSTTTLAAKLTDGSSLVTANSTARQFVPSYMVAQGGDGRPVFNLIGDSIEAGANENTIPGFLSTRGCMGFWQRGLDDNSTSKRLAFGTLSLEGARPQDWGTRANWSRKINAVNKCPNVPFTAVGSNHGNNSVSVGDLYATMQAFWQVIKTEWPGIPIYHSEMIPRPTSTDGFQTLVNQSGSAPDLYNNGVGSGQRWVFNNIIGKGALTGDPTAQARTEGWIAGSFAAWQVTAYDLTTNRDKLAPVVFSTTLAADYVASATTCSLTAAPTVGNGIIFNPNGAGTFDAIVKSVSGAGPFTVTLSAGSGTGITAPSTVTACHHTRDGLHPMTNAHILYATNAVVPWKIARGWV